jgi:hypothetical protein
VTRDTTRERISSRVILTLPMDADSSSNTDIDAEASPPTRSQNKNRKHTRGKLFLPRFPVLVSDPESDEPIQDEVATLDQIMARSRELERTKRTVAPPLRMPEVDKIAGEDVEAMAKGIRKFHSNPIFLRMKVNRQKRSLEETVSMFHGRHYDPRDPQRNADDSI